MIITKEQHPWITKDTRQPSPADRLAKFRAQAAYHSELMNMIGNPFAKEFNKDAR